MTSTDKTATWPGWETVRLIGRGSFGAVYEIERDVFGHKEKAALKVITIPQSASDIDDLLSDGYDEESITTRFEGYLHDIVREYSMMADMKGCANIVYCDDVKYIQHDNGMGWDIFIKMELLNALPRALGKTVTDEQVIKIGTDICSALAFCEKRNLLHRDIKPQNVFVAPDGTYKLGDFGIAKTAERTTSGTKTGTYKYMAPEVYNNQPYGGKADIYSLGLVLYWLLNERRTPFLPLPPATPTSTEEDKARAMRFNGEPIPAPAHGSKELQRIVLKACAFNQKDRYQNAEQMLADLRALGNSAQSTEDKPDIITPAIIPLVKNKTEPEITPAETHEEPEEATVSALYQKEHEHEEATVGAFDRGIKPSTEGPKKKRALPIVLGTVAALAVAGAALFFLRPQYGEWSEWSTTEPEQISGRKIETSTEYRTRELVLLSTDNKEEVVGEVDHEEIGYGDWGEWSDWQTEEIASAEGLDVEEDTQYRSRKKDYTTSTLSSMSGWTLYDSNIESVWGDWSEWSTNAASSSDTRQVETKTQYRYRDKQTTTSSEASMDGWTQYDVSTTSDWGPWSGWSYSSFSLESSASRQVEKRYVLIYEKHYWSSDGTWLYMEEIERSVYSYQPEFGKYDTDRHYSSDGSYYTYAGGISKEGRYRDLETTYTYYFYRWNDWSSWSNSAVSQTSDREVQTQTVYRYKDKSDRTTYYYWQWSNWSDWTFIEETASDETEVETREVFRSREGEKVPLYYYHDWSEWSDWSLNRVKESETCEVESRTVYRYADRE